MPKHLFLLRHAEAQAATFQQTDFDRPLTNVGIQEAMAAGKFIAELDLNISTIICSAARRTLQTAQLVAQIIQVNPARIIINKDLYNAPANNLLSAITMLKNAIKTVLVVAHNPAISEVVSMLSGKQSYYVPTGGCNYFLFDTTDWQAIEWADCNHKNNY